jgi:uncharacterized membrane-anchored protein
MVAADLEVGDLDQEPIVVGVTLRPNITIGEALGQAITGGAQLVYTAVQMARRHRWFQVLYWVVLLLTAGAGGTEVDRHRDTVHGLLQALLKWWG